MNNGTVQVKVSAAMLRQLFHPCTQPFVKTVCKGRCCEAAKGIKVVVHPFENARIAALGATIVDNFIVADESGLCPFKTDEGQCGIHEKKPIGCAASPFTLNKNDTLIVRNRYRLLKCFKCVGSIPAYKAHAWSLRQVFGDTEAQRITDHMDAGGGDIFAAMPVVVHGALRANDDARRAQK